MEIFNSELQLQANKTGFHADILEKVWRLLSILDKINKDSYLKQRLALKGGTALNLFFFNIPRLSVDIDLNYVGAFDTEEMLTDRPVLEAALEEVFRKEGMKIQRIPKKHAGGKWTLRYPSVISGFKNLEVDLNFMFRVPLWEIREKSSFLLGQQQIHKISLFNEYELAAGKLIAFFSRRASRDLFDTHHLLTHLPLDLQQLRFTFFLYGAMGSLDLRNISLDILDFEPQELRMKLIPMLRRNSIKTPSTWMSWPQLLLTECKEKLSFIFPFRENEREFLNALYEHGQIEPALLTQDEQLISKIKSLPLLRWRASLALKNLQNKALT